MAYESKLIHARQREIVRELFVNTADDNYITARWCFVERLNVDFFWLAVHALEKYMKAALLLNGLSGKEFQDKTGRNQAFGHDIETLYEHVESFAADLLPKNLLKPDELETDRWRDETPKLFMNRFHHNGNADNRYQIFGFVRHDDDLFKLDSMVFALRRLCVPLDAYYWAQHRPGKSNPTNRDMLSHRAKCWALVPHCRLKNTSDGKRGERLREVFLNVNLPFAPDDFDHPGLRTGMAAANPVLLRSVLKPLDRAPDRAAAATAIELCDWVLENIKLPFDVREQLKHAKAQWRP